MSAYTLAEAQSKLAALKVAELKAIQGKSFSLTVGGNTRSFTRQDMINLKKEIRETSAYITKLLSGKRGLDIKFGTPYDA